MNAFRKEYELFDITLLRDVNIPLWKFIDYFKGFEKVRGVIQVFGEETEKVLNELKVRFTTRLSHMSEARAKYWTKMPCFLC